MDTSDNHIFFFLGLIIMQDLYRLSSISTRWHRWLCPSSWCCQRVIWFLKMAPRCRANRRLALPLSSLPKGQLAVSFIYLPWTRNRWPDRKPSSARWPICLTANRCQRPLSFISRSRRRASLSPITRGNSFSGISDELVIQMLRYHQLIVLFFFSWQTSLSRNNGFILWPWSGR